MKNLKFRKGEFITQNKGTGTSFAVFEGDVYEPSNGAKGPLEYSLMCFYNPDHYTQDSNGDFKKEYVFECDVDDDTCEYFIDENDFEFWRSCTIYEINQALKFLADEKGIAFDEKKKEFRKLKDGEKISFDPPKSTGVPGGNVQHRGSESYMGGTNPYYRGGREIEHPTTTTKKYITRAVDEAWEQKEPMCNMTDEHKVMVDELCVKLAYSFNSYSNVGLVNYPRNGSQVPFRGGGAFDACGWPVQQYAGLMGNYCGWDDYD